MTDRPMSPFFLGKGEGKHIWLLGGLMTVKASGAETGGALAPLENLLPAGFATPLHVHRDADDPYCVLEGEVTFYCAGEAYRAGPGSFLFLPRGDRGTLVTCWQMRGFGARFGNRLARHRRFRNILVHDYLDYLGLDLETIWLVIAQDLPQLKVSLEMLRRGE